MSGPVTGFGRAVRRRGPERAGPARRNGCRSPGRPAFHGTPAPPRDVFPVRPVPSGSPTAGKYRPGSPMTTATSRSDRRVSPVFLGILAVTAVTGWATWTGFAALPGLAVFLFVTAAWVVSLCLHEYAHARTALHSGDITVGAKGYLSLNPL